jgi:hypothetical protein
MAEHNLLAEILRSLTPASAFWIGVMSGTVVFLTSKLAGTARGAIAGQAQSLHIDLRDGRGKSNQIQTEMNSELEHECPGEAARGSLLVRHWQLDEVIADENLGIG